MAMTPVFVVYVLFAAGVRERIVTRHKVMSWLRRTFAGGFIALGARVAFAEREICPAPLQPSLRADRSNPSGSKRRSGCFVANAPRNDMKSSDLGRNGQAGRMTMVGIKIKKRAQGPPF